MAELKKHALLLSILLLLFITKFLIVPVFEWQDQLITDIKSQQAKLRKTTKLLSKESNLADLNNALIEELTVSEALFYPYQTESAFKLEQQQVFEKLVEQHNLKIGNYSWRSNSLNKNLQLNVYNAQLKLEGKIKDIVNFITALESNKRRIEITAFNLTIRRQDAVSLGTTRTTRLELAFYVNNRQVEQGGTL